MIGSGGAGRKPGDPRLPGLSERGARCIMARTSLSILAATAAEVCS